MQIRDAVQEDFEQITAIYNEVLTHSTAIYSDRRQRSKNGSHGGAAGLRNGSRCWSRRTARGSPDLRRLAIFAPGLVIGLRLRARFTSTPIRAAKAWAWTC